MAQPYDDLKIVNGDTNHNQNQKNFPFREWDDYQDDGDSDDADYNSKQQQEKRDRKERTKFIMDQFKRRRGVMIFFSQAYLSL